MPRSAKGIVRGCGGGTEEVGITRFSGAKTSLLAAGIAGIGASAIAAWFAIKGLAAPAAYCAIVSVALGITTIALFFFLYHLPLRTLERAQTELAEGKAEALLRGITGLLVGNLAVRAEGGAAATPGKGWGALSAIGNRQIALEKAIDGCIADFNGITADPVKRLCFIGDDSYQEGCIAAREAIRILGGKGEAAILLTRFRDVNHALRAKGFANTLKAEAPGMRIVATEENDYAGEMRKETERILRLWLKEYPDLGLIYITEGWSPVVAARIIAERPGKKPKIVAYDVWEDNIEGMELGVIEVLLEQNAYRQGYDPLIRLYNYLERGDKPVFPKITTSPAVVRKDNLASYWDAIGKKRIFSEEERASVEEPLPRKGNKPFKLAFISPDRENFYKGILEGARDAANKLASLGVEVEIVSVYDAAKGMAWGAAVHVIPYLEGFKARGFDGVAITISDTALVPAINEAADAGMAFCTYNGEPFSFREIIESIYAGLSSLARHSETLAAAANESSRSTALINQTMGGIADDAKKEAEEAVAAKRGIEALSGVIGEAVSAMGGMRSSMDEAAAESRAGGKSVAESAQAIQGLRDVYQDLESVMTDLRDKIGKVGGIVETIQGFAEETNVLAINAAIQAARAGDQGKGFLVVATAVRGLAENSRAAAGQIAAILKAAAQSMAAAGATVKTGEARVAENLKIVDEARSALAEVMRFSDAAAATFGAIGKRLSGIDEAGARVRDAMSVFLRITEANGDRVAEISNSTAEMNRQEQDLLHTATELLSLAKGQETLLAKLTIAKR